MENDGLTFGTDDGEKLNQAGAAAQKDQETITPDDSKTPPVEKAPGANEEPDEAGEGGKGGEITHDPLKDTQRAFHQKAEEAKRLREQNEALLAQLTSMKESVGKTFTKLSDEDLDLLKRDDPDAYLRYREQENAIKKIDSAVEASRQQLAASRTVSAFNSVLRSDLGIEPGTEEYTKFTHSPEFVRLDNWITQNMLPNPDGSYPEDAIRAGIFATMKDTILQKQRLAANTNLLNNIENASKGAGIIDKAKGAAIKAKRKIEDYSQDEIAAMGQDELDQLLEMAE